MIADFSLLHAHHVMPEAGGVLDQSPKFLEAVRIVEDEREATARAVQAVRREDGGRRG